MSWPFRFYGRTPVDWAEGANDGHGFSLDFARAPTDPELEQLADCYERTLASGPARPAREAWRWSGRLASFQVGERWGSRSDAFVGAVAGFARAAHALVPLLDVVYHNARGGAGRWDQWSVGQGPPGPCPAGFAVSLAAPFQRPVDASLPAAAEHPVFEAAREAARQAMARAAMSDAVASAAAGPGQLGLARCATGFRAPRVAWPDEVCARFELAPPDDHDAPGDRFYGGGDARPLAWVKPSSPSQGPNLAWLDAANRRRTLDAPPAFNAGTIALHPDGQRVLVSVTSLTGGSVHCVELEAASHAPWYWWSLQVERKGHESVRGAAWADGGRSFAVLTDKRLRVFEPEPADVTRPVELARIACAGGDRLLATREGRAFVIWSYPPGKGLHVMGYVGGKLKRLGSWKIEVGQLFELEGRIVFSHGYRDDWYELTHLDEALEALERPRTKKERAAASAAKPRAPKLALVEVEALPEGGQPIAERLGLASPAIERARAGIELAASTELAMVSSFDELRVQREGCPVSRLELRYGFTGVDIAADGHSVLLAGTEGLYRCALSPESGALSPPELLPVPKLPRRGKKRAFGKGVVALPGGRVLFLSSERLYLLALADDTVSVLWERAERKLHALHRLPGLDEVFLATRHLRGDKTGLGAVRGDALEWLARLDGGGGVAHLAGGAFYTFFAPEQQLWRLDRAVPFARAKLGLGEA